MNFTAFLDDLRHSPSYAGQIAHVARIPPQAARYREIELPDASRRMLHRRGIDGLYAHQADAIERVREGRDVLLATGAASGKSLGYLVPIVERLAVDPAMRACLVFPTKALCQDQFNRFQEGLEAAGLKRVVAGVYDGDTPANRRRKLRDDGAVLFTNPDMLHASLMPHHTRWAGFLTRLRFLVLDELHVYNGIFGSNFRNLMRRFNRVCSHYGAHPQIVACSATVGNPDELAQHVTGRPMDVISDDAGPRGERTYVFWNPPVVRGTVWRSRRSANVEAHEIMARLVAAGAPTITFSKAKMTAELIHRYAAEKLSEIAPHLARKVVPYRGGYLAEERRDIERRLFSGELVGVSTTPALELGIDVGGLDAAILVGYPGTLASFYQQAGRAGRRDRESLVVLVGLDTPANQYIMNHPEYVLGRPIERAVIDADNPYVVIGHLRCATHELPLRDAEMPLFGPHAGLALSVLEGNEKVRHLSGAWYHAAKEIPQHEVSLREYADATVVIKDADTGLILGEVNEFDAEPILHPEAIYMHLGDTFRVLSLDMEERIAVVKREDTDYYTQPMGGTDVHHIDARLREKPFGTGTAYWGEVTAYFRNFAYEKIRFYTLDAVEAHDLDLPNLVLESMAFWVVPPEALMVEVRKAGLDPHRGLRGIGYATRMALPLYITCDTADFSHSVGCANSPWNALFVYERYPHGLGFTEAAYERLHEILPAVLETIRNCPCTDGCPCCTGKPLRQFTTWNVERGEGSIPSKRAATMILEGLLGDRTRLHEPDTVSLSDDTEASRTRLEISLRRRLERMREPKVFHAIEPNVPLEVPVREDPSTLQQADVERRVVRRSAFDKELRKRMAEKDAPQPPILGESVGAVSPHAPDAGGEAAPDPRRESDRARAVSPRGPDSGREARPPDPRRESDRARAVSPRGPDSGREAGPPDPRRESDRARAVSPHAPDAGGEAAPDPRRDGDRARAVSPDAPDAGGEAAPNPAAPVKAGDDLAARARRLRKGKEQRES